MVVPQMLYTTATRPAMGQALPDHIWQIKIFCKPACEARFIVTSHLLAFSLSHFAN